jgi:hypothetical protein
MHKALKASEPDRARKLDSPGTALSAKIKQVSRIKE